MTQQNKHQKTFAIALASGFLLLAFFATEKSKAPFSLINALYAQTVDEVATDDYDFYQKYTLYQKYQNKEKYGKYKKYSRAKDKYGFASAQKKASAKKAYENYKKYKKSPSKYPQYAELKSLASKYSKYKKNVTPYGKYSDYKRYKKYDKKEYDNGKKYGGAEYKAGYNRYTANQKVAQATIGEADLGAGILGTDGLALGPWISIGLVNYSRGDLQGSSFDVLAINGTTGLPIDYLIKDSAGTTLATITANTTTRVKYVANQVFRVYNSVPQDLSVANDVLFEPADPTLANDAVFDFNRPSSTYDKYRGKLKLHYYTGDNSIWAINYVPLEQYVWGMGEIAGTGPSEHNEVMTTAFRTYGYWKIKFSTKYSAQGFKVNATPGNQLYYGYDWETAHPNIAIGAKATRSNIVMYLLGGTNEIALTPYSSWTDGRTRSFEERWGSTDYPWCSSVADSYGKHASKSTATLEAEGNHMVGLSANGSLKLAGADYSWNSDNILKYYFHNINIHSAY